MFQYLDNMQIQGNKVVLDIGLLRISLAKLRRQEKLYAKIRAKHMQRRTAGKIAVLEEILFKADTLRK